MGPPIPTNEEVRGPGRYGAALERPAPVAHVNRDDLGRRGFQLSLGAEGRCRAYGHGILSGECTAPVLRCTRWRLGESYIVCLAAPRLRRTNALAQDLGRPVSGDRHAGLGRDHLAEAGTLSLMVTTTSWWAKMAGGASCGAKRQQISVKSPVNRCIRNHWGCSCVVSALLWRKASSSHMACITDGAGRRTHSPAGQRGN